MKVRRLLVFALLLLVVGGASAMLAVRAARATPDWYAERQVAAETEPEADSDSVGGVLGFLGGLFGIDSKHAASVAEQLQELALTGRVELDDERLLAVVETAMSSTDDGRAILRALEDPQARIASSKIEFGGGIDIDKIDESALSDDAQRVIRNLREWFPALKGRTVYLGLRSVPRAVDGDLHLSRDASLVIGRLPVPSWLIPARGLWGKLDFDLRVLELSDAQIVDDRLVLVAGASGSER